MNDYAFGNLICEQRRRRGLSQSQLADMLGLSAKAVSKWENGYAKPTTDTLRKLAEIFGMDIGELLDAKEGKGKKEITKIVLTGGPCAGKTTGMSWIQNAFAKLGYRVLFVPETATELITGGVAPWTCGSNLEYQKFQIRLQMEKEKIFLEAAQTMPEEKILIVCDRGKMDNRAYMSDVEFQAALNALGLDPVQMRDEYDGVFHLETAAKGAEEFYTLSNNAARTETPEKARALDDRLIAAWTGHPHLRVVGNETDFEDKMKRLVAEIAALLGEPEPCEIERKYLIEYPDLRWLESLDNCRRVEIIQTYLLSAEGEERRVRQRGENGSYLYYETVKRRITDLKRIELERRLTWQEYAALLMDADPSLKQIRKTRYCLTWDGQYFEIDVYPFWKDRAIAEIELRSEDTPVRFPKQLHVIREVTEDDAYRNHTLAGR